MKKIDKIFLKKKVISLDLYLDKVLYDKGIGYYQKKNPFGIRGDFVTAPNISNLFSEMVAIWLISFWENLKKPKSLNFIEMGPGNGDFCMILIKTLKNFPKAFKSINIILYEKSSRLKKIQKKRLYSEKVSWIDNLKKINEGPAIFFGNEFLDALPIKQFKKIDDKVFEKYAKIKKNKVNFIYKKAFKKQVDKLKNFRLLKKNGIIEYPEYGFKELDIICHKIKKFNGGALFIDYGYEIEKNIDTLQSVFKHKFNYINRNIGNADITSLVNFNLYKKYFSSNGLHVENIISQSEFLQKMGIIERFKIASKTMNLNEKSDLYLRIKRLIDPEMMGKNFKVIFAKNAKCNFSLAFK
tara:strand:- start:278 stop:1339 length:1062 start_codon:yes stop_codon:yes gene_type:complete